ncbi:ComF family protein [Tsuneonella amylolytica]|uniref:ComF family protein n=1 Tax=Tsuneonella amylolytica TaxID=2338327 RepID=UPI001F486BD6|nr:ComF family protein [Tsuneonella amylolytica]
MALLTRMGFARVIGDSLAPVVDLVYPPRCPLCGDAIDAQSGLCSTCWAMLDIPGEPACAACQRPLSGFAVDENAMCAPCMATMPRHDGIAAGTIYGPASRKLVLAFKHGRRIALAPMLARLIAARLPVLEGAWLVAPVPLHRWRLWSRGYNQAALLAKELARTTGQELAVDLLRRTKRTPSLGGLGRKARARALSGAIALSSSGRARVAGARILLVDDVLTSGATSEACVRALKKAGAQKVVIACFARVIDDA